MSELKVKKVFLEGAITPEKIASSISHHQVKTTIQEHSIFLGQVSQKSESNEKIQSITFEAEVESQELIFHEIRERAFASYDLTCMHIYHSLGEVPVGQLYFYVFTSSASKEQASLACDFLVKEIQAQTSINRQFN